MGSTLAASLLIAQGFTKELWGVRDSLVPMIWHLQMAATPYMLSHCVLPAHSNLWTRRLRTVEVGVPTERSRVETRLQSPGSSVSPVYLLGQLQTNVLIISERPGPLCEAGPSCPASKPPGVESCVVGGTGCLGEGLHHGFP